MQVNIDGDPIVYASCFGAMAEAKRQGIDRPPLDWAMAGMAEYLKECIAVCESNDYKLMLGGKGNYRFDIYPEYKANRKDVDKPLWYKEIREFMIKSFGAELVDGEEVDDWLGWNQTDDTIICTCDKDLDCIPGWHYNWSKNRKENGVYYVEQVEADRFFYTQCLTGDATDNIPSYRKIVGKNATKKLKDPIQSMDLPFDMYNYVNGLYGDHDWHHIPSCLWIRRKKGEIWEPPDESTSSL